MLTVVLQNISSGWEYLLFIQRLNIVSDLWVDTSRGQLNVAGLHGELRFGSCRCVLSLEHIRLSFQRC